MSVRKRNEFLENDESDEGSGDGYDSDAAEQSRGAISGRASKRRKIGLGSDGGSLDGVNGLGDEEEEQENVGDAQDSLLDTPRKNEISAQPIDERSGSVDEPTKIQNITPLRTSTPKEVAAAQKAAHRSGVIYISRVPPFMKPQTMKHFLAPHASKGLGRIFLTPEDHASHSRRVKSGGNKKKSFADGWVEFISKREAKIAAETLNGNIIGGKKGNFYHDDLWNIKYLKGFKWSHLTEQIANENAERAARMREEVRRTKKENKAFIEDVEKGKMLETMESKRRAKQERGDTSVDADAVKKSGRAREFKQKAVQRSRDREKLSEQVSRMQRMIF